MEASVSEIDNYEIFDCAVFHNSLPVEHEGVNMAPVEDEDSED